VPQAKTAVAESHPLEFSEKHVCNVCLLMTEQKPRSLRKLMNCKLLILFESCSQQACLNYFTCHI